MGFQRSQIIPALWSAFGGPFLPTVLPLPMKAIPKPFIRRVGVLLDKGAGVQPQKRAGKKGIFHEYEFEDVVELGIGLAMQNVGLPQSSVIEYVQRFSGGIRDHVRLMPATSDEQKFPHWLVVRPLALNETSRQHRSPPELEGPISFSAPSFVSDLQGWTELVEQYDHLGGLILLEIGDLVSKIHHALPKTSGSSRGRQ